MIIDIIAGARPNFMKIAPLLREINGDTVFKKKTYCKINSYRAAL